MFGSMRSLCEITVADVSCACPHDKSTYRIPRARGDDHRPSPFLMHAYISSVRTYVDLHRHTVTTGIKIE